jgi:ADP-ribosylation factor GTPase-activating protein 1
MEIYSHPDIPEILSLPGNSNCFDCNSEKPKWTSLNNGIFLCLKCAGIHRSLGVDISIIRSLQIDSWTDKQILYLSKGGNNKFKHLLEEYNIDPNSPPEIKYKSKAADYYRKYLKNEIEKTFDVNYQPIENAKPSLEEGRQLIEIKKGKEEVNNSIVIGSNEQKNEGGLLDAFGSFFNNVKKTAGDVAEKITKQIDELKIGDKLMVAGGTVVDYAKVGGNFIKDKSEQALKSNIVQGIAKTAESGINTVIEKTKDLLGDDRNQKQSLNPNLLKNNENQDKNELKSDELQMSEIVNNNNNFIVDKNNINDFNNPVISSGENKIEEKVNEDKSKEENKEVKQEVKQEENKEESENKNNENINNVIDDKKIEEEKVSHEPENPQNP